MAGYHVQEQHEEGTQPGLPQKKVLEPDEVRRNPADRPHPPGCMCETGLRRHGYRGG